MSKKPRILTIDIETAPMESYHWGLWDQNIPIDFIKVDWSILSYAAKWLDKKQIMYADTGGRGVDKVRDDKPLMGQIHALLNEADVIIAQNGKRFDVRKMNARLIQHGFGPPSPYRVVDTMIVAKKYFAFASQKLAWTSKILGGEQKDEHKKYPGFKLWEAVLADIADAWKEMKKYNRQDVRSTEDVYRKLLPWITSHPNLGIYSDAERPICPKCGSENVIIDKHKRLAKQQGVYTMYHCKDCGGYCRGKTTLLPLAKRRSLLVPE